MTQKPQKNQSEGTTERVVWTPARVLFQGKHAWPELRCPGEPQMNTATYSPRERSITIYTASPKQRRALEPDVRPMVNVSCVQFCG